MRGRISSKWKYASQYTINLITIQCYSYASFFFVQISEVPVRFRESQNSEEKHIGILFPYRKCLPLEVSIPNHRFSSFTLSSLYSFSRAFFSCFKSGWLFRF